MRKTCNNEDVHISTSNESDNIREEALKAAEAQSSERKGRLRETGLIEQNSNYSNMWDVSRSVN